MLKIRKIENRLNQQRRKIIIQRLGGLGLSIPSEDIYTLIKENPEAYLIGKYELLKELYDRLIWRLDYPRAEVSGASVVYKKGLEIDFLDITIFIALFSAPMSIFSLLKIDLTTAVSLSLAIASTGYSILHWLRKKGEKQSNKK